MGKNLRGIRNLFIMGFMLAIGVTTVSVLTTVGTSLYYKWYVGYNVAASEYEYTKLIDSKGKEYKAEIASLVDNKDYSGKTITFYDVNSERQVTLNADEYVITGHIDKEGNVHEKN